MIKSKPVRLEKTFSTPTIKKISNKSLNFNRKNSIFKLESSVKIMKTFNKIYLSKFKDFFFYFKIKQKSLRFLNVFKLIFCKRLQKNLSIFSEQKPSLMISPTQAFSILPASSKIIRNFSVNKELSINLLPARSIFSPYSINYRYTNDEISSSQLLNFDLASKDDYLMPSINNIQSLPIENSSNLSLINSERNILLDYSMQDSCGEEFKFNESRDDSIVELEKNREGTIESDFSPILSTTETKIFKIFQNTDGADFKSTSTMCLANVQALTKKKIIRYSKEDYYQDI